MWSQASARTFPAGGMAVRIVAIFPDDARLTSGGDNMIVRV